MSENKPVTGNNSPNKNKGFRKCPFCDSELKQENAEYCSYCKIEIRYCSKCGSPVSNNIALCPNCGAKL